MNAGQRRSFFLFTPPVKASHAPQPRSDYIRPAKQIFQHYSNHKRMFSEFWGFFLTTFNFHLPRTTITSWGVSADGALGCTGGGGEVAQPPLPASNNHGWVRKMFSEQLVISSFYRVVLTWGRTGGKRSHNSGFRSSGEPLAPFLSLIHAQEHERGVK